MQKKSAGLLIYRFRDEVPEVMLVHPGGPFWTHKDAGAWSIPKGEFEPGEDPLDAAVREVREETGIEVKGTYIALTPVKQKSGKMVYAWAVEGDYDVSSITSNTCMVEWPSRSGRQIEIPEVDKAAWFTLEVAEEKINSKQVPLLVELENILSKS